MKVHLANQPWDSPLGVAGRILTDGLQAKFDRGFWLVAFAKRSGVGRMYAAIQQFVSEGGTLRAVIGLDQLGTTRQGAALLVSAGTEVRAFHDVSPGHTFHPKGFLLENTEAALILIGSSNLTAGGLFTNHELSAAIALDLSITEDRQLRSGFIKLFDQYWGSVTSVSFASIAEVEEFAQSHPDLLPDEDSQQREVEPDEAETTKVPPNGTTITSTFKALSFPAAPGAAFPQEFARKPGAGAIGGGPETDADAPPAPEPVNPAKGALVPIVGQAPLPAFWKVLSAFDVSSSSAPGQIIIPKAFEAFFPPLTLEIGPDAGGHGRQWAAEFNVTFSSGASGYVVTPSARLIKYEPRTGHLRPNTELRFTFRNQEVLGKLSAGDILVFRRSASSGIWLDVMHLSPTHSTYTDYYTGIGQRFGTA